VSFQPSTVAEMDLARRARAGDEAALTQLYQSHREPLYRHARRMLGEDAAARDVVQEAFTRAITAMPRTREELHFRPWIYRIATNLCLRELTRRARCAPPRGDLAELGRGRTTRQRAELEGNRGDDPERSHQRREATAYAQAALERLPPQYRQILLLREMEDMDYEELRRVLELRLSMVRVSLHRARARFRALFAVEQALALSDEASTVCPELRRLLRSGRSRRLERHLDSCPRCREERPAAELLALLPPLPLDLLPASPAPLAMSAPSGMLGLPGAAVGAAVASVAAAGPWSAVWVLALSVVLLAGAAVVGFRGSGLPDLSSSAGSAIAQDSRQPAPRFAALPPEERTVADRPRLAHLSPPPASLSGRSPSEPSSGPAEERPARAARQGRPQAGELPGAPPGATSGTEALRLRIEHRPGTIIVRRGGRAFSAGPEEKLLLGDVLSSQPGSSMLLRLPEDQWLVFSGQLKLVDLPTSGERKPRRVIVELLEGEARARATSSGRGVVLRARARLVESETGEYRVKLVGDDLRVQSLSAYVQVRGPHAARMVTPGRWASIGARPGFAEALLPSPTDLRPGAGSGTRPPLLSWSPVPGAPSYRVTVGSEANFWLPEETAEVEGSSYLPRVATAGRHFWQGTALRHGVEGAPSKVFAYVIARSAASASLATPNR